MNSSLIALLIMTFLGFSNVSKLTSEQQSDFKKAFEIAGDSSWMEDEIYFGKSIDTVLTCNFKGNNCRLMAVVEDYKIMLCNIKASKIEDILQEKRLTKSTFNTIWECLKK